MIDTVSAGQSIIIRAFLQDSDGAIVTSGTTTCRIYEEQSNGTLKSYDFDDNTFKTTALTTATLALTHRTGNNGTVNTGIWTAVVDTVTGFTSKGKYYVQVENSGASPVVQTRLFEYGGLITPANKSVFDSETGEHTWYDEDEETPLVTMVPSDVNEIRTYTPTIPS